MSKNKGAAIYKKPTYDFKGFEPIKDNGTMVVFVPKDFYIPNKKGVLILNPKYRSTYPNL